MDLGEEWTFRNAMPAVPDWKISDSSAVNAECNMSMTLNLPSLDVSSQTPAKEDNESESPANVNNPSYSQNEVDHKMEPQSVHGMNVLRVI